MHAFRIGRSSALVIVFTFVCTLLISLEDGWPHLRHLGIARCPALPAFRRTYAHMFIRDPPLFQPRGFRARLNETHDLQVDAVVLGQDHDPHGGRYFVPLRDCPRAVPCDANTGMVVLRPVASLFFGNAQILLDDVSKDGPADLMSVKNARGPSGS